MFGTQGGDALATDNITLNGNKIVQFQPGGTLPTGYTGLGSFGTSAGVTGLPTSGGDPGVRLDGRPAGEQHGRRADLRHFGRCLFGVPACLGDDHGQGGRHALRRRRLHDQRAARRTTTTGPWPCNRSPSRRAWSSPRWASLGVAGADRSGRRRAQSAVSRASRSRPERPMSSAIRPSRPDDLCTSEFQSVKDRGLR